MTWDEGGRHVAVNEDIVSGQIYRILKQIQVPRAAVLDVAEYLKSAKEMEFEYHQRIIAELTAELNETERRKKSLLNLYLDGKIADDTYTAKDSELRETALTLRNKINAHVVCDNNTNDTIVAIFNAAASAADVFSDESSEVALKRDLLKRIFRTLELKEKNLCYDLKFPFNMFTTKVHLNNWRALADDFRTNYVAELREIQAANWDWRLPQAA